MMNTPVLVFKPKIHKDICKFRKKVGSRVVLPYNLYKNGAVLDSTLLFLSNFL